MAQSYVTIFGYEWTKSQGYLIMWVLLTILLVILATKNSGLANGLALTVLFAVAVNAVNDHGTKGTSK